MGLDDLGDDLCCDLPRRLTRSPVGAGRGACEGSALADRNPSRTRPAPASFTKIYNNLGNFASCNCHDTTANYPLTFVYYSRLPRSNCSNLLTQI